MALSFDNKDHPIIANAKDYYPYGKMLREFGNGNGVGNRFVTTQHERDDETGLDYRGARYYDSDVARFLSLDPLAAKYPAWSAYNYVVGNPIAFSDPDGKDIIGLTERSAERVKAIIDNSFTSSSSQALRDLFQIDGQTFRKIDPKAFEKAIVGLSDDERALATGYFMAVNDDKRHVVSVINREEQMGPYMQAAHANDYKALTGKDLPSDATGSYVDESSGGGFNFATEKGDVTCIVMNSSAAVKDFKPTTGSGSNTLPSESGELLAHELLGHGLTRQYLGANADQWKNAILMSNIYLRIQNKPFYRTGESHGGANGRSVDSSNKEIPSYIFNFMSKLKTK